MSINRQDITYNIDNKISSDDRNSTDENFSQAVYPMNGLTISRGFYTVFELKRKYEKTPKTIILDSDFQRSDKVWNSKQKSELIESVLMGIPIPLFYFNEDRKGRLIVIDGRQRLTTLFDFLNNKFTLKNLPIMAQFNGFKFETLDPISQSKIEDYQIQSHNIPPNAPDKIKLDIFDRVNRGGTKLTDQEIINALHQGKSTDLLKRISNSKAFSNSTENAYNDEKRMKDRYILLRFISIYLYFENKLSDEKNIYKYKNDMYDLLEKSMEYLNKCSNLEIEEIELITINALENSFFYIPVNAFRFTADSNKGNKRTNPINMNIFEMIMYAMTMLPFKDSSIKNKVQTEVDSMKKSTEFKKNIGDHRDSDIKLNERIKLAKKIVEGVYKYD